MITELEQEFYDTFGIEPKKTHQIVGDNLFFNVIEDEYYPEITDRKLLELIGIVNKYSHIWLFRPQTYKTVKEEIIKECIALKDNIPKTQPKHNYINQVKALFEDKENV